MRYKKKQFIQNAIIAASTLGLMACGGDGDDDSNATPTPASVTLSGQVARSGTVKNVVVCMDLNANNSCDDGEPASAATGDDGKYSLTYDPSVVTESQAAATHLIAPVLAGDTASPTTAIDSDFPTVAITTNSYVMTRPAGSGGAINPLTTLVQAGMANGMTEAVARQNVGLQLMIDPAKIDNYQDDPPQDVNAVQDNARMAAAVASAVLRYGGQLSLVDQMAAVSADQPGDLAELVYTDSGNFRYRRFVNLAKAADVAVRSVRDVRVGKSDGADVTANALFNVAYLTSSGWKVCDDLITSTQGNPSRSTFCGAQDAWSMRAASVDLSGQLMTSAVSQMNSASGNTINNGVGSSANLTTALASAQFPQGSLSTWRAVMNVNTPVFISALSSEGVPQSQATTLAGLIAARQVSQVNLSNGAGSQSLGWLESSTRNLRVAFSGAADQSTGTVQYYGCDLSANQQVVSNCAPVAIGTYTITTEGGVRVMRFQGHPTTVMLYTNGFAEADWGGANGQWVYRMRETKPTQYARSYARSANRLNSTAWEAMKAQLGL